MRKYFWSLSVVLVIALASAYCAKNDSAEKSSENPIRMMTFNIRLNTPDDGPNQWIYRKEIAASMVRFHRADIFGVQEALKDQMDDLTEMLPEYGWFGVGRDDGKEAGEYMSVFYLKNRFDVIEHATFWLSETPEKPTKGWDAMCYRVVTWGKFKDLETRKVFYLFNTHFDHKGEVARRESAKLLLDRIEEIAGDSPVVVTGDFNATPESVPYRILTNGLTGKEHTKLVDAKQVSKQMHHGPNGTITQFKSANLPHNKTIDYIFIKNDVSVISHGSLSDTFDGRFPSDHMPVLAEVVIE
ncbi:endonuclease [candidate division KSB1 bacterium]|nr:endonuclease [candidate division KSB1 bacterium]